MEPGPEVVVEDARRCGLLRNGGLSPHGCGEWKPLAEFAVTKRNICSNCYTLYRRASNHRRPEKKRAAMLWRQFRITPEDYDRMRAEQDYRCAICRRHEGEVETNHGRRRIDGAPKFSGGSLVVDHCHESNVVRKLLCSNCNRGLGSLGDSPEVLRAALEYLLEHQHLLDLERRPRPMPLDHRE